MSHRIAILVVCVALGLLGWRGMFSLPSDDSTASVIVSGGSSASASDLAALIDSSRSAATLRNEAGLTLCTSKITGILDREFSDLYRSADSAAKDIATYGNCVTLVTTLASDKVFGGSEAEKWVRDRIDQKLGPNLERCQNDVQAAVDRLDRDLAASTLTMASELAALGTIGSSAVVPDYTRVLDAVSLEEALGDLGVHGVVVPPCIAIDVYALMHNRIVRWLITKILTMAKWIFARPMAAAAVEVGLVAVDGPLPIGDAIAVLGAAWTAWDISCLRSTFEKQLVNGIRETLPEARRAIHEDIWESLRERMASHADLQKRIQNDTTESLLH